MRVDMALTNCRRVYSLSLTVKLPTSPPRYVLTVLCIFASFLKTTLTQGHGRQTTVRHKKNVYSPKRTNATYTSNCTVCRPVSFQLGRDSMQAMVIREPAPPPTLRDSGGGKGGEGGRPPRAAFEGRKFIGVLAFALQCVSVSLIYSVH